jgi:hypothetical protein
VNQILMLMNLATDAVTITAGAVSLLKRVKHRAGRSKRR